MVDKYCMNCGVELNEDNKFCPSCGQPVNQDPEVKELQEIESVELEIEVKPQIEEELNTEQQVITNEPKKERTTGIGGCIVAIVIVLIVGFLAVKLIGGIWHIATGAVDRVVAANEGTYHGKYDGSLHESIPSVNDPYPVDLSEALIPADFISKCNTFTSEDVINRKDKTAPVYSYTIGVIDGKDNYDDGYKYDISPIFNGAPTARIFTNDNNLQVGEYIVIYGEIPPFSAIDFYGYEVTVGNGNKEVRISPSNYKTFNPGDYGYTVTTN